MNRYLRKLRSVNFLSGLSLESAAGDHHVHARRKDAGLLCECLDESTGSFRFYLSGKSGLHGFQRNGMCPVAVWQTSPVHEESVGFLNRMDRAREAKPDEGLDGFFKGALLHSQFPPLSSRELSTALLGLRGPRKNGLFFQKAATLGKSANRLFGGRKRLLFIQDRPARSDHCLVHKIAPLLRDQFEKIQSVPDACDLSRQTASLSDEYGSIKKTILHRFLQQLMSFLNRDKCRWPGAERYRFAILRFQYPRSSTSGGNDLAGRICAPYRAIDALLMTLATVREIGEAAT